MPSPKSVKARVHVHRFRALAQGRHRIELVLSQEALDRLDQLAALREISRSTLVEQLLAQAVSGNEAALPETNKTVTSEPLLVTSQSHQGAKEALPVTHSGYRETVIAEARRLSAAGMKWDQIAAKWSREGKPTLRKAGQWYGANVKRLVRRG